jgi:hypothetical protein
MKEGMQPQPLLPCVFSKTACPVYLHEVHDYEGLGVVSQHFGDHLWNQQL